MVAVDGRVVQVFTPVSPTVPVPVLRLLATLPEYVSDQMNRADDQGAKDMPGAIAVMAMAQAGSLLYAPDVYMDKLAVGPGYPEGIRAVQVPDPSIRSYFLSVFGRSERVTACACERSEEVSLPQLLHLQNGQWIADKMGNPKGKLKTLISDKRTDNEKISEMFLTTLSRLPTEKETSALVKELAKSTLKEEFYQDAFWALLNTVEFSFNH
jgi:hypothetical protein